MWGGDPQATQDVPADLTTQAGGQAGPVQALAVGFRDQMVALLEDGAVRAWWSFGAWDVDLGRGVTGAAQVAAGYNLGVALTRCACVPALLLFHDHAGRRSLAFLPVSFLSFLPGWGRTFEDGLAGARRKAVVRCAALKGGAVQEARAAAAARRLLEAEGAALGVALAPGLAL